MQKNWVNFYKCVDVPNEPSTFAKFVMELTFDARTCVDLGSGNGRDTYYLAQRYLAHGVDPAVLPDGGSYVGFTKAPWRMAQSYIKAADIVYSRFFLHSINNDEIEEIVKLTPKYFCAEARAQGDSPVVYPTHERNYIDGGWLFNLLIENGFDIQFYEVGTGLAPYENEDPLLVRVIAKRK